MLKMKKFFFLKLTTLIALILCLTLCFPSMSESSEPSKFLEQGEKFFKIMDKIMEDYTRVSEKLTNCIKKKESSHSLEEIIGSGNLLCATGMFHHNITNILRQVRGLYGVYSIAKAYREKHSADIAKFLLEGEVKLAIKLIDDYVTSVIPRIIDWDPTCGLYVKDSEKPLEEMLSLLKRMQEDLAEQKIEKNKRLKKAPTR